MDQLAETQVSATISRASSAHRSKAPRRPPRQYLEEAIKLLEADIALFRKRVMSSEHLADHPPHSAIDPAYWRRTANGTRRKIERMNRVVDWMRAQS